MNPLPHISLALPRIDARTSGVKQGSRTPFVLKTKQGVLTTLGLMPHQEPTFGDYVFQIRQSKGWSLREAAKRIGIAHSRLDEIEKMIDGRTRKPFVPSYINVVRLAKAYGLPPDELLRRAGYEPGIELEPQEWRLVKGYRSLPDELRGQLLQKLETLENEADSPR